MATINSVERDAIPGAKEHKYIFIKQVEDFFYHRREYAAAAVLIHF